MVYNALFSTACADLEGGKGSGSPFKIQISLNYIMKKILDPRMNFIDTSIVNVLVDLATGL